MGQPRIFGLYLSVNQSQEMRNKIPTPYPVQNLTNSMNEKALMVRMMADLLRIHNDFLNKLEEVNTTINKKVGPKGDKGDRGEKGNTPDIQEIARMAYSLIRVPKDGKDGRDGKDGKPGNTPEVDLFKIAQAAATLVPRPKDGIDGKNAELDVETLLEMLSKRPKGKRLKMDHIDGWEQTMRSFASQLGKGYVHGGGDTVAAGTGITLVRNSNGTVTISASSISGTILDAVGTIDDTNTQFTFTQIPQIINVNGAFYRQTGGSITWTWDAGTLTATLSVPVGTGGSIFGQS